MTRRQGLFTPFYGPRCSGPPIRDCDFARRRKAAERRETSSFVIQTTLIVLQRGCGGVSVPTQQQRFLLLTGSLPHLRIHDLLWYKSPPQISIGPSEYALCAQKASPNWLGLLVVCGLYFFPSIVAISKTCIFGQPVFCLVTVERRLECKGGA